MVISAFQHVSTLLSCRLFLFYSQRWASSRCSNSQPPSPSSLLFFYGKLLFVSIHSDGRPSDAPIHNLLHIFLFLFYSQRWASFQCSNSQPRLLSSSTGSAAPPSTRSPTRSTEFSPTERWAIVYDM